MVEEWTLDAIGFVLASAFLGVAFAAFELLIRVVGGVAGAVRYSVAPSMAAGFRWWSAGWERRAVPGTRAGVGAPDTGPPRDDDAGTGDGLVVPVERVIIRRVAGTDPR